MATIAIKLYGKDAENGRVGSLIKSHIVLCDACLKDTKYPYGVALCMVNIAPYGAQCHRCGITLVRPSAGWPELFTSAPFEVACLTLTNERVHELWGLLPKATLDAIMGAL